MENFRLIGFGFNEINAKKNLEFKERYHINLDIKLISFTEKELNILKDTGLEVGFEFSVNYPQINEEGKILNQEGLGKISINGSVAFMTSKENTEKIIKSWKDKKLNNQIRELIINLILQKATLKAFQIEEELNLPLHVPIPRVSINNEDLKK
jgi:hypothetical protein